MSGVIKPGVQAKGIICMHSVAMARICVYDRPTERLKGFDCENPTWIPNYNLNL